MIHTDMDCGKEIGVFLCITGWKYMRNSEQAINRLESMLS